MQFLMWLLIGGVAGWLAGKITRGGGFGVFRNVLLGVLGAVVGGFLFRLFGLESSNWIGSLVTATVGAVVVLALVRGFSSRR